MASAEHSAEYNALIEMTDDLCNALPISDLIPKMISKRVIDFNDKAEIRSERTDRDRVHLFLLKLTGEMVSGENEKFYNFIKVMKESPKCSFLVQRMERRISHYKQLSRSPTRVGTSPQSSLPISTGKVINKCKFYLRNGYSIGPVTGRVPQSGSSSYVVGYTGSYGCRLHRG